MTATSGRALPAWSSGVEALGNEPLEDAVTQPTPPQPRTTAEHLAAAQALVDSLRPHGDEPPCDRILHFVARLEREPGLRGEVKGTFRALLGEARAVDTLASAGILGDQTLVAELAHVLFRRLLPPVFEPGSLAGLLQALFHHRGDAAWLSSVPPPCWTRLQQALDLEVDPHTPIPRELALAIRVLAHRIGALGMRPALTSRVPELRMEDSPFLFLSDEVLAYVRSHGNAVQDDELPRLQACQKTLDRCRAAVDDLRANKQRHGTSLELTSLSFRMHGMIERLELLLALTAPGEEGHGRELGSLVVALVKADEERDRLDLLVKQHADLLVFQVVEHAAHKGRKYITRTRAEYGRFLLTSMAGGLLVALFAFFKVKLAALELPLALQATAYSLNYALCFVLIYLTGSTLATKQPAVTAHALGACLDGPEDSHHLDRLVEIVARVWRSQFVSFVGNLVVAFPVGLLLARGWLAATGTPLAAPAKATHLVTDLHPWLSGSLFFAGVAGVYLFSAGLVAGWVDNRLVYSRVPQRIAAHPALRRSLGRDRARALADFTQAKAGALLGNLFLGFCLGSTGILGHIVGLPVDIRHIAFSSAHLAMGLDGLGWALPPGQIAVYGLGVSLIGLVNFLVSFGLALLSALESRQLGFGEGRQLMRLLMARLWRRPLDFFFPPRDAGPELAEID